MNILRYFFRSVKSLNGSKKKTNDNKEVVFIDHNDEIELTEDINNLRKKRRRSSASVE